MNREEAYDKHISPLMTQIIALCKEHDIPMLASFQYNDDRAEEGATTALCTTALPFDNTCEALRRAINCVRQPRGPAMMLTTRNAAGEITNMTAILP